MKNAVYWNDIVNKLTDKNNANWAAHVLASNIEVFNAILPFINKEILIKNCLLCYSISLSAQTDLDAVFSQFSIKELVDAYKKLDKKPIETAGAFMWLLEDLDPQFKWAS